ncbi:hypothetical protein JW992_10240, partial [candidate division KSB1 bacterium]|nr:hypothetical protein [candidate division KSB1 bacterium]
MATAQTLRPDHWLADQLQFEQFRGRYWEFSPQERPVRLKDWHRLDSILVDTDADYAGFVARRQAFFQKLPRELENLLIWVHSRNRFERDDQPGRFAARQTLTLGMPVTDWLDAYTSIVADNRIDEAPHYLGKEQMGLAGYTEQAYVQAVRGSFSVKVGRDFLSWGSGRDATLLLSQVSRPMDQITIGYESRFFAYRFFTASLDPMRERVEGEIHRYSRYLSGHRL